VLRVVLDVNVLVSGLLDRPGPPAQILRAWYAGAFELVVSPLLLEADTAPPAYSPREFLARLADIP